MFLVICVGIVSHCVREGAIKRCTFICLCVASCRGVVIYELKSFVFQCTVHFNSILINSHFILRECDLKKNRDHF